MDEKDVAEYYKDFADDYDETVLKKYKYTAYKRVPAWIVESLKADSKDQSSACNIIDLGCGTGLSGTEFFNAGHQVTGVDVSEDMVKKAKLRPYKAVHCQGLEGPLPGDDSSYDGAALIGVLEFIKNIGGLFKSVYRKVRPGGYFGFTVPLKIKREHEVALGIATYAGPDVEKLAKKAGWNIVRSEFIPGYKVDNITVAYRGYLCQRPLSKPPSSSSS